jgi:hypothetical protein
LKYEKIDIRAKELSTALNNIEQSGYEYIKTMVEIFVESNGREKLEILSLFGNYVKKPTKQLTLF